MPLYLKRALVGAKIEASYGVDPTIAGVDAFLVRDLRITPMNAEFASRDLIRAYFGNSQQLPVGVHGKAEFSVELAGSGTPATAPKWGRLMRACAMSETTTAADVTGTATAGATRSITLAAGASAVDDFYNGMYIDLTGGTGSGQQGVITDYVGSTKVATVAKTWGVTPGATTTYAIKANVQYRPVSANFDSVAFLCNYDGVQHKFLGCRGSVSLALSAKGIPLLKFMLLGLYTQVTDTAQFVPDYSQFQTPLPATSANTPTFVLHDTLPVVGDFSFDLANAAVFRQKIGSEAVIVSDRKPSGSISFDATTVAGKDWWTIAKNGSLDSLAMVHGTVSGNRAAVASPFVQIKPPQYSEDSGILVCTSELVLSPGVGVGNDELYVTAF